MVITHVCIDCNIEFRVKHDADSTYYPIRHCPFCGKELDVEEQTEVEIDDEVTINT